MADDAYVKVTKDDFEQEVLRSEQPVLVDFWAEWCAPCHAVAPVLDELAREFEGRARVVKVNVDEEPELARRYDVRSVPSLLFFRGGGVAERLSGVQAKSVLSRVLEGLLAA